MADEEAARALKIASDLHGLVEGISTRLETARKYGRRTRLLSWACGVLLLVCLGLTAGVVRELVHEHNVAVRICASGNDARAAQRRLWGYVLRLSSAHPPPGETPAQRRTRLAEAAQFRAYVAAQFAPLNCR